MPLFGKFFKGEINTIVNFALGWKMSTQISQRVQIGHKDTYSVSCAAYIAQLLTIDNWTILPLKFNKMWPHLYYQELSKASQSGCYVSQHLPFLCAECIRWLVNRLGVCHLGQSLVVYYCHTLRWRLVGCMSCPSVRQSTPESLNWLKFARGSCTCLNVKGQRWKVRSAMKSPSFKWWELLIHLIKQTRYFCHLVVTVYARNKTDILYININ